MITVTTWLANEAKPPRHNRRECGPWSRYGNIQVWNWKSPPESSPDHVPLVVRTIV